LTTKQKRYLQAQGSELQPVVQIGKAGVAPSVVAGAGDVITARELVKVRVLRNCPVAPQEALAALAKECGAELVQVIGRNGLLYRRNQEKPKFELPV
jgi:RNA-binding protein